jgi:sulfur-carrier protein
VARLRLFGPAREAARASSSGAGIAGIAGDTVGEILDGACATFGPDFAGVLAASAVWVNGEPAGREHPVGPDDEVAVLPPVSGG